MTRDAYHQALELERRTLFDEIVRLKATAEHAVGNNRLQCIQRLRTLERRHRAAGERLRSLQSAGDSVWGSVKITWRWLADGFAGAIEGWTEQVSARQSLSQTHFGRH